MDVKIEESWKKRLADEFEKDYFKQLTDFVKQEYRLITSRDRRTDFVSPCRMGYLSPLPSSIYSKKYKMI